MEEIRIFGALIDPPYISPCCSNMSKIIDALTLNLLMMFSSVDFETILWARTGNPVFKIELTVNGCGCLQALHKLEGWKNSVKSQKIIPLKNGIYLLISLAFGAINLFYYHLKLLCHYLNIKFYSDDKVLKARIAKI